MELAFIDNFNRFKKSYTQHMEPICQKWGLTQNETAVLIFLHDHPIYNRAADLVNYCGMVKSHASKSVSHLEALGYLDRLPDESDHRAALLHLTEAAAAVASEAVAAHDAFLEQILRGVTREELQTYQNISAKIAANITSIE